ncbi:MAG: methyltransferase domain-containing protein [Crocinitomicaceae bacterium]|nr:methyltransferase domain-containing protein [Crocinitomicaceae bacterium]
MYYDPIKKSLGKVFNRSPYLRILFYHLLDLLLLRTYHIKRELRKWKQTAPRQAHILDAGSGFGQYSYFMSKFSDKYCILGVDVKADQVGECNEFFQAIGRQNVVFRVEDITKFRKENCFDLILCVDVMEHIEDDVEVLRNYQASLKSGGVLLISTPSDQGGSDVTEEGETSFIEEHVRDGYGIQEIKDKIRQAGFNKVKVHFSYGVPGRISWRLSMKYPMKMLNISQIFFIVLPFYYLLVMPISLILNFIDSRTAHSSGTGLIVLAWK